ncbi:type III pantothenate kinase [Filimonas lacunae]|uniref:Type III pantothenate kinase n=1 Tax=Filimonas lacunae TaxID=477680 RepID=A0A173MQW0_9BACT|nr:type III pantothenate kinase [Filimonas lacunae]BAV09829.1 pantothenate kinase type III, CoaX-like [Filimonas lacunae]SIS79582.1 type III pantothenate kinase [Filimonas lacunae]
METTLCFDFGNTRLKCAIFEGEQLKDLVVLADGTVATIEGLIQQYKPTLSILASVIHHDEAIEGVLAAHTRFHKLTYSSKIPVNSPVGKPETIGADRLALVVGAVHMFPNQHNLVIGLGSCITFNFVNKFSEFLGGSISPGLEMRFRAMHEFTAKLPLVKPDWNFPLIGYDTRTNMLSGVILGMSKEIDGMIDLYKEKYTDFNVLLTGGDMNFFLPHLKNNILAEPYLLYKGLYAISQHNAELV